MAETLHEITAIVREVLRDPAVELTPSARFDDLVGWDSMDLVTVVVEIECRLNLQFELIEIDRLITVGDLMTMITAKQALTSA